MLGKFSEIHCFNKKVVYCVLFLFFSLWFAGALASFLYVFPVDSKALSEKNKARSSEDNYQLIMTVCDKKNNDRCACIIDVLYKITSPIERVIISNNNDYWGPLFLREVNYWTIRRSLHNSGFYNAEVDDIFNNAKFKLEKAERSCSGRRDK
jgi:hypothetical protein